MPSSISSNDKLLLHAIESVWQEARTTSGPLLLCRPGCTECCMGPIPVNQLDAIRLREGLARLPEPAATAVRLRAGGEWRRMRDRFPGDAATGLLDEDESREEAFCLEFAHEPCPALDPRTGRCDLYEYRPMSCRTIGPPARVAREDLPHCHLCYHDAGAEQVEQCRVEFDPDQMEDAILTDLEQQGGAYGQTIIPFVLK